MRLRKLFFGLALASIAGSTMALDPDQGGSRELKELPERLEAQENKQQQEADKGADTTGSSVASDPAQGGSLELKELQQRLEELEKKLKEDADKGAGPEWLNRLSFVGLVELEGSYTDNDGFSDDEASDIVVATVELAIGAVITDDISAELAFLYEEDDTDFEVDIATIAIDDIADLNINLQMGQFYQPFGSFETNMVNDTLVLEAAETRETSALIGWGTGPFSVGAYVFNGDVDSGDDTLDNFGLTTTIETEDFTLGFDYISNVYDSDAISDLIPGGQVDDKEGAFIARGATAVGPVNFIGEYFIAEELGDFGDIEPKILHLEVGMQLGEWLVSGAYQTTDDAVALGLPENRYSVSAGTTIVKNVAVTIEYWYDEDYDESDGGTDDDANSIVAQITVLF
jgi:hypothetical protein